MSGRPHGPRLARMLGYRHDLALVLGCWLGLFGIHIAIATGRWSLAGIHALLGVLLIAYTATVRRSIPTVVLCRTFHSRTVEADLVLEVLPAASKFARVIVIENTVNPGAPRPISIGGFAGFIISVAWFGGLLYLLDRPPWIVVAGPIGLLFINRWLIARFFDAAPVRTITGDQEVQQFRNELRQSDPAGGTYIRRAPQLYCLVGASNASWPDVVRACLEYGDGAVIDVTDLNESKGLGEEVKAAIKLLRERRASPKRVLFFAEESQRERAETSLRELGLADVWVIPYRRERTGIAQMSRLDAVFAEALASEVD